MFHSENILHRLVWQLRSGVLQTSSCYAKFCSYFSYLCHHYSQLFLVIEVSGRSVHSFHSVCVMVALKIPVFHVCASPTTGCFLSGEFTLEVNVAEDQQARFV